MKPAEEFAWRRKKLGQRDTFCRPCRSAYDRKHYEANRERYIEQARVQKKTLQLERTSYLIEYFKEHPCVDCGELDPVVLEFDHLRDKSFSIGPSLSRRSWQSILDEIEKCEVVCATAIGDEPLAVEAHFRGLDTRGLAQLERATGLEPAL